MNALKNMGLTQGLIAAVSLLLLGLLWIFIYKKPVDVLPGMQFHADAVKELKWHIEGQEFKFSRASRSDTWQPEEGSSGVQVILNSLSIATLQKMNPVSGDLKIDIVFGPDNIWSGDFDGKAFVWREGLLAGMGIKDDVAMKNILSQGRYAFLPKKYPWCDKRIKKSQFQVLGLLLKWSKKITNGISMRKKKWIPPALKNGIAKIVS